MSMSLLRLDGVERRARANGIAALPPSGTVDAAAGYFQLILLHKYYMLTLKLSAYTLKWWNLLFPCLTYCKYC